MGHSCNIFTEKIAHLLNSVLTRPLHVEEYRRAGKQEFHSLLVINYLVLGYMKDNTTCKNLGRSG